MSRSQRAVDVVSAPRRADVVRSLAVAGALPARTAAMTGGVWA